MAGAGGQERQESIPIVRRSERRGDQSLVSVLPFAAFRAQTYLRVVGVGGHGEPFAAGSHTGVVERLASKGISLPTLAKPIPSDIPHATVIASRRTATITASAAPANAAIPPGMRRPPCRTSAFARASSLRISCCASEIAALSRSTID